MEVYTKKIMDALDVETFFICKDEEEGRKLMLGMLKEMGFSSIDIVFAEHLGLGARVRGRAYVHRPADHYAWLEQSGGGCNV